MKIFIPVHTKCSPCGSYYEINALGVGFKTKEKAEEFLKQNPNNSPGWGNGEQVEELEIIE